MKKLQKQSNIEVAKNYAEDGRKFTKELGYVDAKGDPLEELGRTIEEARKNKTKDKSKMIAKISDKYQNAAIALGLDTHYPLARSVSPQYRPLVIEVVTQIEKEYSCTSPSEKALAEIAAGALVRQLRCSRKFNSGLEDDLLSNHKNSHLGVLSKEIDRANRMYITAIQTIKQLKRPQVDLKVKANTAFVAENQQINAFKKVVEKHENNNPK